MISTRQIAAALGGQVAGPHTVLCPGPKHSRNDRSLAVRLDPRAPDGFVCFSHAGDDWQECRDHVRARLGLPTWQPGDNWRRTIPQQHVDKWDFASVEKEAAAIPHWDADELGRINYAQKLWDEAKDPRGTLAEKYLREQRKLEVPDELAGIVLRFHPACPRRDENTGTIIYVPALIVPFKSIDNDTITGVHRIALRQDGTKIDRRMLGIIFRTAIKLDPVGETQAIAEGVETAMAARQLGFKPVWALGSVGAISFFPIIDTMKQLTILGERGEASARAIKVCGTRWRKAGRQIRVVMPDAGFRDLNDILMAKSSP
jgi:hypothetical protein